MIITKIESQKNKERVNIYIDNKFAFGLSLETLYKYNISKDMEVNKNFIENVLRVEEENKAINQALSILSYRQRSEKEVYLALKKKNIEEDYIEKAIDYCKEYKYIDDLAFAKAYVREKTNLNKLGPGRIKFELINKGISKEIIDTVLVVDQESQYITALEIGRKRMRLYRNDDRNSIYRKLGGYLQRRGYSYEIISNVLRDLLKELGE